MSSQHTQRGARRRRGACRRPPQPSRARCIATTRPPSTQPLHPWRAAARLAGQLTLRHKRGLAGLVLGHLEDLVRLASRRLAEGAQRLRGVNLQGTDAASAQAQPAARVVAQPQPQSEQCCRRPAVCVVLPPARKQRGPCLVHAGASQPSACPLPVGRDMHHHPRADVPWPAARRLEFGLAANHCAP